MDLQSAIIGDRTIRLYGELIQAQLTPPSAEIAALAIPAPQLAMIRGMRLAGSYCIPLSKAFFAIVRNAGTALAAPECSFASGTLYWDFRDGEPFFAGSFSRYSVSDIIDRKVRFLESDIYLRFENVRYDAGSLKGTVVGRLYIKEFGVVIVDWSGRQDFSIPLGGACLTVFDLGILKVDVCIDEVDVGGHRAKICARGKWDVGVASGTFAEACVPVTW